MTLESKDTIPSEIIITLYMVASDIDGNLHGPFTSYHAALAFAEPADGSVFECTARLIEITEV
jgi:hypothetical protein